VQVPAGLDHVIAGIAAVEDRVGVQPRRDVVHEVVAMQRRVVVKFDGERTQTLHVERDLDRRRNRRTGGHKSSHTSHGNLTHERSPLKRR